jgi:hypothetical protein
MGIPRGEGWRLLAGAMAVALMVVLRTVFS